MDGLENKKLALLRILEILKKYSDIDHPLFQEQIIEKLELEYGILLERRAVSRNLELLKEAGYPIKSTRAGTYLIYREFEDYELRMLIDGVLSSKYITANHSKELIEKLCNMSNKYFRSHVKHVSSVGDWAKTNNQSLFYNIELIDEAIQRKVQLKFDYNKYGIDKKLHKTRTHTASPYQLILHNQRYYLMAHNEYWKLINFFRVDHITNMVIEETPATPINKVEGYESGIDYKDIATSMPYLYPDKIENIEFIAHKEIVDQIIDWFGLDIRIKEIDSEKILVSIKASPMAMQHWATQYINHVEITKPLALREKIKESLTQAAKKYE